MLLAAWLPEHLGRVSGRARWRCRGDLGC